MILGLENWDIKVRYHSIYKVGGGDGGTQADATGSWEYMNGTINFFLAAMIDCGEETWEPTVVHELCHFIVMEMRDPKGESVSPHEERVVTMLEKAFIKAQK